jgi:hypothetical protein
MVFHHTGNYSTQLVKWWPASSRRLWLPCLSTGWRDRNGCLRTIVSTIHKLPVGSFTFLQFLSGTELLNLSGTAYAWRLVLDWCRNLQIGRRHCPVESRSADGQGVAWIYFLKIFRFWYWAAVKSVNELLSIEPANENGEFSTSFSFNAWVCCVLFGWHRFSYSCRRVQSVGIRWCSDTTSPDSSPTRSLMLYYRPFWL